MERADVMKIVEEELALDPTAGCTRHLYFRLTLQVAFMKSLLLTNTYRKILISSIQLQVNLSPFKKIPKGMERLEGKPASAILFLYDQGHAIGEFLLAEYERGTPEFRSENSKHSIAVTISILQFFEKELSVKLSRGESVRVNPVELQDLEELAVKAQKFILGDEQYAWFLAESEDAIAIAKEHPRLARLLRGT